MALANRIMFTAAAAVLLAAFCVSCDYLEAEKIESALEGRAEAVTTGDVNGYLSRFSPAYRSRWMPYEKLAAGARQRLAKQPYPKLSYAEREITIKGEEALLKERFVFEDASFGKPRRYDEVQHLDLKKVGGGWTVVGGSEVLNLLGGRIEEEIAIEKTLLRREAALVDGDISGYMSLISDDYDHRGEGPEDIRKKVARNFQIYDDIEFRSYDREIKVFGDSATVIQRYTMSASMLGEPKSFSNKERFELVKTKSGWKFVKGL